MTAGHDAALRTAIEAALAGQHGTGHHGTGHGRSALSAGVARLMTTYRSGAYPEQPVLASARDAAAYAAYRMPATAAAVSAAIRQLRLALPGWSPASLADLGAGTGGAAWAAVSELPGISTVALYEQAGPAASLGRDIFAASDAAALRRASWHRWRLPASGAPEPLAGADLVTAAYILSELSSEQQAALTGLAGAAAGTGTVLLVEPGTPAGHRRVLAARDQLLGAGFTIVAPCPHQLACPVAVPGDWCHFAARVQRSAVHRQAKGGELPYEDEKFSYVAAIGDPAAASGLTRPPARLIRRPQLRKNLVLLDLCAADGTTRRQPVGKSSGETYRQARKVSWGDGWPAAAPSGRAGHSG